MATVKYVGIHNAVDVPMDLGGWQTVRNGEILSTSDEHAASLLEQPLNWVASTAKEEKVPGPPSTPPPRKNVEEE